MPALNRARPPGVPRCVLITGSTGGIGAALALEYARAGCETLLLHGRNQALLADLAERCQAAGARVLTKELDVRDTAALRTWLEEVGDAEMPELVIANAGVNINTGPDADGETWAEMQRLLDVNVVAAMATAQASAVSMQKRGFGQIALLSSLAAWRGLPDTPSYSASKAAIKAYGEGMRDFLRPMGIRVNVIMPGYVESQMCRDMPGPKPFLWPADKAARVIRKGLAKDRPRISFPFPLNLGCFLLSMIHPSVSGWILTRLGYRG